MKLKQLESYLQDVDVFACPKVSLEQYSTRPHIAARMLYTIHTVYNDILGRVVLDLGCGCGMISIGASMLGAAQCIGVDVDSDALHIMTHNVTEFSMMNVDCIQADITQWQATEEELPVRQGVADVVIMNPPFGTKRNAGIDMTFLRHALSLSNRVYSLHKTSTREHILKKAREWSVRCEVLAELRFDLPNSYKFHKQQSKDIEVDLMQFIKA